MGVLPSTPGCVGPVRSASREEEARVLPPEAENPWRRRRVVSWSVYGAIFKSLGNPSVLVGNPALRQRGSHARKIVLCVGQYFKIFLSFPKAVYLFIFESKRETEGERERERQNPKQALNCRHRAGRRARTHELKT